ncbi:hypothetical protein N7456_005280 [Penicillium angulare]|uniref:MACPF domain-containing protein n=1 Tax=Penicillium angulare TaxID=116970 RepID=A0A9W9FYZ8_9EURO|nr:hypothetical protein N7456_005280 [Penicillium angulare]
MAGDELFSIWTYDKAGKTKVTDRIVTESIKDGATLADIRAALIKGKLDSKKARFPFCTSDGARMGDQIKWDIYKKVVSDPPIVSDKEDTENSGDAPEATSNEGTQTVKASTGRSTGNDVYFELSEEETERKYGELGENVKKMLESPLNMEFASDKVKLLTAGIKDFQLGGYDHSQWMSNATADTISAGSLSDTDWDLVGRATHFLNGHRMVFTENQEGRRKFQRVDRAPYSAFAIKARSLEDLGTTIPNVQLPTKDPILYRYPLYTVTDDSYVNVFETASALSNSLASSSFSQMDIEASIGGGLFGYSAGIKAGFSQSERQALASNKQSKNRSMNITYNFPRVILHLDSDTLDLTSNCKKALDNIISLRNDEKVKNWQEKRALINFYQKFGQFFATNVELGGKLFSKEQFTSTDDASSMEKANAMKISAAISFSSPVVQASASYSQEKQSSSGQTNQSSNMNKALSWEAVGGDTTLCNNPPAWSPTVKPFKNWRVINQKDVMAIGEFIGTFEDYKMIPDCFRKISEDSAKEVTCRFRLRADPGADGNIKGEQYYGLRYDANGTKNEGLFDTLQEELINDSTVTAHHRKDDIKHWIQVAKNKFKGEGFTVGWHEWVGIDPERERSKVGGCTFQLPIETQLGRPPRLRYNTPYSMYNQAYNSYLAADVGEDARIAGRTVGILYYTRTEPTNKFVFLKTSQENSKGEIEPNASVELHYCNENDEPIGQVKRNINDEATLGVELYSSRIRSLYIVSNSTMTYDDD